MPNSVIYNGTYTPQGLIWHFRRIKKRCINDIIYNINNNYPVLVRAGKQSFDIWYNLYYLLRFGRHFILPCILVSSYIIFLNHKSHKFTKNKDLISVCENWTHMRIKNFQGYYNHNYQSATFCFGFGSMIFKFWQ